MCSQPGRIQGIATHFVTVIWHTHGFRACSQCEHWINSTTVELETQKSNPEISLFSGNMLVLDKKAHGVLMCFISLDF